MTAPCVVHLIDEFRVGGAQTHLVTMLTYLNRFPTVEHHVVSLFGDGPIGDQIRALGTPVSVLDLRPDFKRRRFDQAIGRIRSVLRDIKPSVAEAHLTWSRLLGLAAARLERVPIRIGFEQGDIYLNSPPIRVWNFVSQGYADQIIVCSAALGKWVQHTHHISPGRLVVMHNCVDETRFQPAKQPAADVLNWRPAGTVVFAMVGSLGTGVNKRVDVGIRAIAGARQQGSNVGLVIAGDGSQRRELETLTSDLGISEWVLFLGVRNDIPEILAACDAFCHAAPFEPFGIVALEAMAMCLPVVVPDTGGISEVVQPGITGVVYPALDVDALSEAIGILATGQQRRMEIGRAARESILRDFTVERYVKRLYHLYGIEL